MISFGQISPLEVKDKHEKTPPSAWKATKWFAHKVVCSQWEGVGELDSVYACNAPEIHRSGFQRSYVLHFTSLASWVDLGPQVHRHIGWFPECAPSEALNVPRILPPELGPTTKGLLFRQPREDAHEPGPRERG